MSDYAYIPEGFHSVTPSLTLKNAAEGLEFYRKAFGAEEIFRLPDEETGKIMHAEFRIGNSLIMVSDEYPEWNCLAPEIGKGGAFMIYVEDVEAAYVRAVDSGATGIQPVEMQFWGDKIGRVADPYGYRWSLAQKVREVSPEEIAEGARKFGEKTSSHPPD